MVNLNSNVKLDPKRFKWTYGNASGGYTIPNSVYRYMTQSSGQLNRCLVDYYLRKMIGFSYDFTIYTAMAANGKVMEE